MDTSDGSTGWKSLDYKCTQRDRETIGKSQLIIINEMKREKSVNNIKIIIKTNNIIMIQNIRKSTTSPSKIQNIGATLVRRRACGI